MNSELPSLPEAFHPLSQPEYVEYVARKYSLLPLSIIEKPGDHFIQAVLYLNKKGQIRLPKANPYFPVKLSVPEDDPHRMYRQRLELMEIFLDKVSNYRISNRITFPPEITDIRPFIWTGYQSELNYTLLLDLPPNPDHFHSSIRKNIRKCERSSIVLSIADDLNGIIDCVRETEERQNFYYNIEHSDLVDLAGKLKENFRLYVAKSEDGKVVAMRAAITAGKEALDFLAATRTTYLSSGVTQGIISFMLEDLTRQGISRFDFSGAGIRSVAQAKADWGARLQPVYSVSTRNLKWFLLQAYNKIKTR